MLSEKLSSGIPAWFTTVLGIVISLEMVKPEAFRTLASARHLRLMMM